MPVPPVRSTAGIVIIESIQVGIITTFKPPGGMSFHGTTIRVYIIIPIYSTKWHTLATFMPSPRKSSISSYVKNYSTNVYLLLNNEN